MTTSGSEMGGSGSETGGVGTETGGTGMGAAGSQMGAAMSGMVQRMTTGELVLGAGALLILGVDILGWIVLGSSGPDAGVLAVAIAVLALIWLRRLRGMPMEGGALSYESLLLFLGLWAGFVGLNDLRSMLGAGATANIWDLLDLVGLLAMGVGGVIELSGA